MMLRTVSLLAAFSAVMSSVVAQTNTFPASGNVGIGTTTPRQLLQVNGGASAALGLQSNSQTLPALDNGANASLVFQGNYSGGMAEQDFIDTSVPSGAMSAGFRFMQMTGAGTFHDLVYMSGSGNVGIGTTSPAAKLDVQTGAINFQVKDFQTDITTDTWGGWARAYRLYATNNGTASGQFATFGALGAGNNISYAYMALPSGSDDVNGYNTSKILALTSSGNVGIGTTSPAYRLDVAGQIRTSNGVVYADGTQQTTAWTGVLCGGDYAESVDVTGNRLKYEPGDVLVVDSNAPGRFLKGSTPYSTLVAGVYSTKPGLVGRHQQTPKSLGEVPMAVVGIVPTKATAENGPIQTGDLLVTSSQPGYAMKGTDRSRLTGAVVGKALAPLPAGNGVIEVLVTLQ